MPDYKRMYAILCAAAAESLDLLPELPENEAGRELLQMALLKAEEAYITAEGEETDIS